MINRRHRGAVAALERTLGFTFPHDFERLHAALSRGHAFRDSPLFRLLDLEGEVEAERATIRHPDLVPVALDLETAACWSWRMEVRAADSRDTTPTVGQWVVFDRETGTLAPLGPSFLNAIRAMLVDAEARAAEREQEATAAVGLGSDLAGQAAEIRGWVAQSIREHRMLAVEPPQSIPQMRLSDGPHSIDNEMLLIPDGPMSESVRSDIPAFESVVAQNHFASGMLSPARDRWIRALGHAPDCVAVHWGLAICAAARGDAEEAAYHHLAVVEGDWTTAASPPVGPEPMWTANIHASLNALRQFGIGGIEAIASSPRIADVVSDSSMSASDRAWRGVVQDLISRGRFSQARRIALSSRVHLNRPGEQPLHPEFHAEDLLQQIYFAMGLQHRVHNVLD